MNSMAWSKGFTKETHPSVLKISQTMKMRGIDNFAEWRSKMRKLGKIPTSYSPLKKSEDLAEYIGVVLGDGNIGEFPRSERITISCNSHNFGFIKRYTKLTRRLFRKQPAISKVRNKNNVRISLYQKEISKRLAIPCGNRSKFKFEIPKWIKNNRAYLIRFLRGLYEAEGSFCIHKPTSTYKIFFSNRNKSLLNVVSQSLNELGFYHNTSGYNVQISRKNEVYRFKNLIKFRIYDKV